MDAIFRMISQNVWVLIPLTALFIPIAAIAVGGFTASLHYRHRRDALEALKTYAANGQEPPPAVLAALAPRRRGVDPETVADWKDDFQDAVQDPERQERRRRRRIAHDWRNVVWSGAVGLGFFLAWSFIDHNRGFLIVTIIMTCITVASLIQAVITTSLNRK